MRFARFQHIRDERGSLAETVWLEEVHDEDDVSRRKKWIFNTSGKANCSCAEIVASE